MLPQLHDLVLKSSELSFIEFCSFCEYAFYPVEIVRIESSWRVVLLQSLDAIQPDSINKPCPVANNIPREIPIAISELAVAVQKIKFKPGSRSPASVVTSVDCASVLYIALRAPAADTRLSPVSRSYISVKSRLSVSHAV